MSWKPESWKWKKINMAQTKNDKPPKSDERMNYKARPKYDEYTLLNASLGGILNEIMNVESKDSSLDVPKPLRIGNDKKDLSKLKYDESH